MFTRFWWLTFTVKPLPIQAFLIEDRSPNPKRHRSAVEVHEALTGAMQEPTHYQGAVGKDAPNHGLATIEATPLLVEPYLHDYR